MLETRDEPGLLSESHRKRFMTQKRWGEDLQRDGPFERRRLARFIHGRHASPSEQADDLESSAAVASRKQLVRRVRPGVEIATFGIGQHLLEQTRRTQPAQG